MEHVAATQTSSEASQSVVYMEVSEDTFEALTRLPEFAPHVAVDNGEAHIQLNDRTGSLYLYRTEEAASGLQAG